MSNKLTKITIIIFSIIFAIRVVTIFGADRLYSMSLAAETGKITPDAAIKLLDVATNLDSTNADLYFRKYEILNLKTQNATTQQRNNAITQQRNNAITQQLRLLTKCINLCPSWSAYHLYYALTLKRMSPKPNLITRQLILSELESASDLKPYSSRYRQMYERYAGKVSFAQL
jgi:hypothetical protein